MRGTTMPEFISSGPLGNSAPAVATFTCPTAQIFVKLDLSMGGSTFKFIQTANSLASFLSTSMWSVEDLLAGFLRIKSNFSKESGLFVEMSFQR